MFSIVELKTATLDYGIPGISATHMLLVFVTMFAIPMIPYAFLYLSLRGEPGKGSMSLTPSPRLESTTNPFRKMVAWVHAHRHPVLLHH